MSSSLPLTRVAKQIIRKAAEIGVEEAGTRILGPTAWGWFRQLFEPVWTELERRYPELLLVDTSKAAAAAESAVEALDRDEDLQSTLVDGFRKLGEGQVVITAELTRVNETLTGLGASIEDTRSMSREILDRIVSERSRLPTEGLSEVDMVAKVDASELPEEFKPMIKASILMTHYTNKILEYGEAFTAYSFVLPSCKGAANMFIHQPTEHRLEVSGQYEDQKGRTCRDTVLTYVRPDGILKQHENSIIEYGESGNCSNIAHRASLGDRAACKCSP